MPAGGAEAIRSTIRDMGRTVTMTDKEPFGNSEQLDTISRQAAISHVDDVPYIKDHPNVGLLWKAWIESLPSAQPERKKGKWIVSHIPDSMLWECNQCGFDCGAHSFNFCPNCGADMRGEQNG